MIIRKEDACLKEFNQCHGGSGILRCAEMLADYKRKAPGVKFYHDNILPPGGSVGEHRHKNDEEIYIILDGSGVMKVDGRDEPVKSGDICITRTGHRHSLLNTGATPMRFLVIGIALQNAEPGI